MIVAGIMSGTSLDGIDVAITEITGRGWNLKVRTLAHRSESYPARIRERLLSVSNTTTHTAEIAHLNFVLPELYAKAVRRIWKDKLDLVGCHGQTIFHDGWKLKCTLQIGDGSVLAERLGVPVVSDFRPRDMAAGGQGAPLVPFVDYLLFRDKRRSRVALNIGGIANITLISAGAKPGEVTAFDTGPGNMVMDALMKEVTGNRQGFDKNGAMAAKGKVNEPLLKKLLANPYFRKRPPKTAGREQFGKEFTEAILKSGLSSEAMLATATELTAQSVAVSIRDCGHPVDDVIVSGGGARNVTLLRRIGDALPGAVICKSTDFGVDADAKEAIAFAVLAYESFHGRPSNMPGATGARHPVVLGKISR
ncbi:MAG: anhydro-N-acetylmuramic acid kinase [Candidatus Solibacter usitatus]|nr:anhydro-N-acetylmuramic acid kinase [Candidatus Solibacter usitatus]